MSFITTLQTMTDKNSSINMKWWQLLADHDHHVILLRFVSVTPRETKLIQHTPKQDVHTYPTPLLVTDLPLPYIFVESICDVMTRLAMPGNGSLAFRKMPFHWANCLGAASRSPLGIVVPDMDGLPSNRYPLYLGCKPAHVHCIAQTLQGQGRELEYDENDASSFR